MPKDRVKPVVVPKDERQCLYRGADSQIFTGPDAVEAALEDGWHDHPDAAKAEMPDEADEPDDSLEGLHIEHALTVESLAAATARVDELEAGSADLVVQRDSFKDELKAALASNKALTAEVAKLNKKAAKK